MDEEKLSGRVIIDTILANMRQQVEELRYSKIVPAAYDVYLHEHDQQRFETLAHEIAAEAVRALQEALDGLNRPSRLDRVREIVKRPRLPFKKVGPWLVRIARDPDGAVPRGRALVVSQIALGGGESFEGQRTRRLATLSEGRDVAPSESPLPMPIAPTRSEVQASRVPPPPPSALDAETSSPVVQPTAPALVADEPTEHEDTREMATALAMLSWRDDTGEHVARMTGLELTVGRAAQNATADVRLATLPDVSRIHLRLRYHPEERRFSIEDLSLLGTTINGERLERNVARTLPPVADLRLADQVTLRFESVVET